MKLLIAKLLKNTPREIRIYKTNSKMWSKKEFYKVCDNNDITLFPLCFSLEQAVLYACEHLELIEYQQSKKWIKHKL